MIEVKDFPKYIPSLAYTYKQCNMLRYWLNADPNNIAVVMYAVPSGNAPGVDPATMALGIHARVVFLLSAFLAYLGEHRSSPARESPIAQNALCS